VDSGAYFWFGGAATMIAAIGEFILGNTFAFTIFAGYG
jgi:succinate-acetate transporter protein